MIEVLTAAERRTGSYAGMSLASHLPFVPREGSGVGPLVICDDCLLPPGTRFPMHPHQNDETISYVRSGTLHGKDDSGTEITLSAGSVGSMSAGRGMQHEEWVPEDAEPVRMYHIAVWPRELGLEPRYLAREPGERPADTLRLIASGDGRDGSLPLYQDLDVYDGLLTAGGRVEHRLRPGRVGWLTVPSGAVRVGDTPLEEGDSATIRDVDRIEVVAASEGELLLFDVDPGAPAYSEGTRFGGS